MGVVVGRGHLLLAGVAISLNSFFFFLINFLKLDLESASQHNNKPGVGSRAQPAEPDSGQFASMSYPIKNSSIKIRVVIIKFCRQLSCEIESLSLKLVSHLSEQDVNPDGNGKRAQGKAGGAQNKKREGNETRTGDISNRRRSWSSSTASRNEIIACFFIVNRIYISCGVACTFFRIYRQARPNIDVYLITSI